MANGKVKRARAFIPKRSPDRPAKLDAQGYPPTNYLLGSKRSHQHGWVSATVDDGLITFVLELGAADARVWAAALLAAADAAEGPAKDHDLDARTTAANGAGSPPETP